jgi:hypothetical protein
MTESKPTDETLSADAEPVGEYKKAVPFEDKGDVSSSGTLPATFRLTILVRSHSGDSVTIPFSVERDQRRVENLRGNRPEFVADLSTADNITGSKS